MSALAIALAYRAAGLSVIPVRPDGSKRPTIPEWTTYQERLPEPAELRAWFGPVTDIGGFAVIGGPVSGNLEILDIDDPAAVTPWWDMVDAEYPGLIARLPVALTPRGGIHVYYRCEVIGHNQKLAMYLVDGKPKTRIETRGMGGYALVPPTGGQYHPSGRSYSMVQSELTAIPTITPEERGILLEAAVNQTLWRPEPEPRAHAEPRAPSGEGRIGDQFNEAETWERVLEPHGWTLLRERVQGKNVLGFWRRPGKLENAWSATTGYGGYDVLYVFTSNAWPFEPNRGYRKFTAYVLLNFGNSDADFRLATKCLAARLAARATIL